MRILKLITFNSCPKADKDNPSANPKKIFFIYLSFVNL
ncbi:hypothetical protein EZBTHKR_2680 [Elizabethkingia anophelis]|nr:hypothetical protein EZBTHKR_2680 [Elizabethkingia anophelis]